MCPRLAPKRAFLAVLNLPEKERRSLLKTDNHIAKMDGLLREMAHRVWERKPFEPVLVKQINRWFDHYRGVSLILAVDAEDPTRLRLAAGIRDQSGNDARERHLAALISLLESVEEDGIALGRCAVCREWFVSYNRASVHRFCSTRCRSWFHYRERKGSVFHCVGCERMVPWKRFSGLAASPTASSGVVPGAINEERLLCQDCTVNGRRRARG